MRNQGLRTYARSKFVHNYEIAEALGVSDNTFYVMLRKDLTDVEKERIIAAIDSISKSKFAMGTNLRAVQG